MAADSQSRPPPGQPGEEPQELRLSPWLRLMLAEIARKREDLEQARAEELRRAGESDMP